MGDDPFSLSSIKIPARAWEWIFRLILLCIILWMRVNYVSVSDFLAYKELIEARRQTVIDRLDEIKNTLTRIDEKMKADGRRDAEVEDLKKRMRDLEMHKL